MMKLNKQFLLASVFAVAVGSFVSTASAADAKDPKALMGAVVKAQEAMNTAEKGTDSNAKEKAMAELKKAQADFDASIAGMKPEEQADVKKALADQMKGMTAEAPAKMDPKTEKMNKKLADLEGALKKAKPGSEKAKKAQKNLDEFKAQMAKEGQMPGANQAAGGAGGGAGGNGGMLPVEGASCNDDKVAGCEAGKTGCTYQKSAAVPATAEAAKTAGDEGVIAQGNGAPVGGMPTEEEIKALKKKMGDLQEEGGAAFEAAKKAYEEALAKTSR